jgi:hypothetical protein
MRAHSALLEILNSSLNTLMLIKYHKKCIVIVIHLSAALRAPTALLNYLSTFLKIPVNDVNAFIY